MIDDDAVAFLELPAAGADLDDLAARLVAGDHALVAFGALAEMLVVNAADVGAADGGGLHAQQNFAVAGRGARATRAVRRCCCRGGWRLAFVGDGCVMVMNSMDYVGVISPSRSQRSSQRLAVFPEEDLAFDQAAVAVDFGDGLHLRGGERVLDGGAEVGDVIARVGGKGNRHLAALHGPLDADQRGMDAVALGDARRSPGSSISTVSSGVRSRSGRPGRTERAVADGHDAVGARRN